jgi:hypothetical protein
VDLAHVTKVTSFDALCGLVNKVLADQLKRHLF